MGRNLHIFVSLDILQGLLQGEDGGRNDAGLLVGTAGTDVGQLLCLAYVDDKVYVVNMLSYNLAGIHLVLRFYEELAPILQMVYGICIGIAALQGNQRTVGTAVYLALERLVLLEAVRHDGLALRGGEHIGSQADDTARGDVELYVHTVALTVHTGHFALAARNHVYHLAAKLLGHVYGQFLNGFAFHTVNLLVDNLRLANLQLITLAAHGLHQYGEMQHATSAHYPAVGVTLHGRDTQGQVLLQFLIQTFLYVAAGAELAFLTEERRVIYGEEHGHRGFVDADARQSLGILVVANGVAYLEALQSHQGTDVATSCLGSLLASHAGEGVYLLNLGALLAAVAMHDGDVHALSQGTAMHTAYGNAAGIVGIVQTGYEHLRCALQLLGGRHMLQNLVQ